MSIGIVDAMLEKGEIDGRAVWLRVVKARLGADEHGVPTWGWKLVKESNKERLLALVRDGITNSVDAAEELGLTRGGVSKLKKKLQKEGKLKPGRKLALP